MASVNSSKAASCFFCFCDATPRSLCSSARLSSYSPSIHHGVLYVGWDCACAMCSTWAVSALSCSMASANSGLSWTWRHFARHTRSLSFSLRQCEPASEGSAAARTSAADAWSKNIYPDGAPSRASASLTSRRSGAGERRPGRFRGALGSRGVARDGSFPGVSSDGHERVDLVEVVDVSVLVSLELIHQRLGPRGGQPAVLRAVLDQRVGEGPRRDEPVRERLVGEGPEGPEHVLLPAPPFPLPARHHQQELLEVHLAVSVLVNLPDEQLHLIPGQVQPQELRQLLHLLHLDGAALVLVDEVEDLAEGREVRVG
mmetsp:Transcript_5614/g.22972  ORF Transcript_5614/g.22972 Transcript_5614/m.22972 type:complete len:314 (+) Transcript_5614:2210-3151(+)